MANNIPDFRTAGDLIRAWFLDEERCFEQNIMDDLTTLVRDWVFSAYLQGHEDGYNQGYTDGYDNGQEEGSTTSYDDGYDDARAEFDNDW